MEVEMSFGGGMISGVFAPCFCFLYLFYFFFFHIILFYIVTSKNYKRNRKEKLKTQHCKIGDAYKCIHTHIICICILYMYIHINMHTHIYAYIYIITQFILNFMLKEKNLVNRSLNKMEDGVKNVSDLLILSLHFN